MKPGYVLGGLVLFLGGLPGGELWAQCEGHAGASTSYTSHSDCGSPNDMLEWSLTVHCFNACGQLWTNIPAQRGSAYGDCSGHFFSPTVCSPYFAEYNYTFDQHAQTSAWNRSYGFLAQQCKDDGIVITGADCECAPPCEPTTPTYPKPPKPEPCSQPVPEEVAVLGVMGPADGALQPFGDGLFSGRMEEVDGLRYVMEDWAVVSRDAVGRIGVLSRGQEGGSSPRPAVRYASLESGYSWEPEGPASIALLIAPPRHPQNGRHIPRPTVGLRPAQVPHSGEPITAAVRIDIGEDRAIRDAQVLYAVGSLPGEIDLAREVRDRLEVRYASEQRHRVIVYAVVDVEDGGMVHLRDSEIVLPLCCCYPICK